MFVIDSNSPQTNSNSETTIQIMVVEDEKIIAINLKENLESLGYTVVAIAASGEKAIEKATQLRPDLVLMDIRLKGNMDGIEAAYQIWEHLQIPTIYVTGHSDKSTLERAKVHAPFGYLLKPIKERELSVAIEIALQRYAREQMLSSILRGMGDGVIVVDQDCRVKSLNQVAQALTGWQQNHAQNRDLTEIFNIVEPQTRLPIDNPIKTAIQQGKTVYLPENTLLVSKDGEAIAIGDSAAPIRDNKGVIVGGVLVFRDISAQKQIEEVLRQQLEKERKLNQLQTQFIHTVSHEYRTPLSVILACSQLLETSVSLPSKDKVQRNCQKIQNAVKYMVALLENISTFGQAEAGQLPFNPTFLDLQQFCKQLIQEYQLMVGNRHHIQLIGRGKSRIAYVDNKLLQLILRNLISNSLKYSPAGSQISLAFACKGKQVIFEVKDRGIGIPPEDQTHIFEPFHRAENVGTIRGSGMGLAIVKKAVDLHGGTISVHSQVGVGSTFTVTLPGGII